MISLHSTPSSPTAYFMANADRDDEANERADSRPEKAVASRRVLIVEDEFFISLNTELMLENLGHVVVGTAVSADEAVRIAELERPDVILMGIRLIGPRDGIEAAAEIHDRFGIGSIFITANTDPMTRQRALAAHPRGFIEKPLTDLRLREALSVV